MKIYIVFCLQIIQCLTGSYVGTQATLGSILFKIHVKIGVRINLFTKALITYITLTVIEI